ncbi:MAG TPA: AEC family transporter [Desulfurobacteriaceae bacterium]|nr:AEC family transporter [Desulfurobacteriaceae bacterium]
MFQIILEKILPLYILIFSGYIFGKRRKYDLSYISDVVFYLLAPILVFISVYKLSLNSNLILKLVFANTFYVLSSLAILSFIFYKADKRNYKAISLSLTFSNVAYLGLPLIFFLYGDKGLEIAVINFLVISFLHFSLGIYYLSGNFKELISIPFLYTFILAIIFKKLKISLSSSLINFMELTGKSSLPLMLVSLGTRLASISFEDIFKGLIYTLLKFIINFFLLILSAKLFSLKGLEFYVFVLQNILPSAILNYVFCEKYNKNPNLVSSIILFSTVFSLIYIPLVIILLRKLF